MNIRCLILGHRWTRHRRTVKMYLARFPDELAPPRGSEYSVCRWCKREHRNWQKQDPPAWWRIY